MLVYHLPDNFVGGHFGYWAKLLAAMPNPRLVLLHGMVEVVLLPKKKCCCGSFCHVILIDTPYRNPYQLPSSGYGLSKT